MMNPVVQWPRGRLDFTGGCLVMGILNVTPDSFSDGGQFLDPQVAVERGLRMASQGAAMIDVGGESARPGSKPVSPAEQIRRTVPVIGALAERIDIPISIDTADFEVARTAVLAGASILNDITALSDARMAEVAVQQQVPVILMHMQGTPATMQAEPRYDDVVAEVRDFLVARAEKAVRLGIPRERIFLDPGIGFGKTARHNLQLIHRLDRLSALGRPVVLGASRKRFLGAVLGTGPEDRLIGTVATTALGLERGAAVIRVHDVMPNYEALRVSLAIMEADR